MERLELFLHDNWWVLGLALLVSIISLALLPVIVVALPADYFLPERRRQLLRTGRHPLGYLLLILKNLFGVVLLVLGAVLLVLPGQGLLTMFIGLMLMDFPGKYRLERWLVGRGRVLEGLNWLRARRGKKPLVLSALDEVPSS